MNHTERYTINFNQLKADEFQKEIVEEWWRIAASEIFEWIGYPMDCMISQHYVTSGNSNPSVRQNNYTIQAIAIRSPILCPDKDLYFSALKEIITQVQKHINSPSSNIIREEVNITCFERI